MRIFFTAIVVLLCVPLRAVSATIGEKAWLDWLDGKTDKAWDLASSEDSFDDVLAEFVRAQTALEKGYSAASSFETATAHSRRLSSRRVPAGDFVYGMLHLESAATRDRFGDELPPYDKGKAIKLLRRSAESGYAPALYTLGLGCLQGKIVPENECQAEVWLTKVAEQGVAPAEFTLGQAYLNGSLDTNDEKAFFWLKRAADRRYAHAEARLGGMYLAGRGTDRDLGEAVRLFRSASRNGESTWNLVRTIANSQTVGLWFIVALPFAGLLLLLALIGKYRPLSSCLDWMLSSRHKPMADVEPKEMPRHRPAPEVPKSKPSNVQRQPKRHQPKPPNPPDDWEPIEGTSRWRLWLGRHGPGEGSGFLPGVYASYEDATDEIGQTWHRLQLDPDKWFIVPMEDD